MVDLPPANLFTLLAETDGGRGSQHMLAAMLVVLGIALMAILISASARSKASRRSADRPTPRERIEQIKSAGQKHQSHAAPHAEQLERLHEFAAMLDNKAERIEQLLAEADERIALLRAMGESAGERRAAPLQSAPLDPLAKSVYELADAGRSPIEIAQELDEQVGKVDLILALRCGGGGGR